MTRGHDALAAEFAGLVGETHVLVDPDLRAPYETDWTGRFRGAARLVVRPGDTGEVAAVLAACAVAGAPVVTQGGNTGLVGGSVPRNGSGCAPQVLLSTRRLTRREPVDTVAGQVTVGAGVTLADLHAHAEAAGLRYGVDFAARGSATVGGSVATNAGGIHFVRHGATRRQVLGVEAVLVDGRVLRRLTQVEKDNTGYDLPGLLTGSEGTLAVVTRVRLRLLPAALQRVVAIVAVDGTAAALALFARVRGRLPGLEAVELFYADGLELVCAHTGASPPFPRSYPAYLLIECAAAVSDPTTELAGALDEQPEVTDVAVGTQRSERARLWRYREAHTEAVNAAGVPHKLDVTLPLPALAAFESQVRARVRDLDRSWRTFLWGHAGDGNLHVNVVGPAPDDDRVDRAVLELVAQLHGSISAEHGVGVAKVAALHLTRTPTDIATMRAIKQALDPAGLLNPGVLLP